MANPRADQFVNTEACSLCAGTAPRAGRLVTHILNQTPRKPALSASSASPAGKEGTRVVLPKPQPFSRHHPDVCCNISLYGKLFLL